MNKRYTLDTKCVFYAPDKASRVKLLKAMNETVGSISDENAYAWWIEIVPDQASDDDFEYIAEDQELCDDVCRRFALIMNRFVVRDYKQDVEIDEDLEDC